VKTNLNEVIQYENEDIVLRFQETWDLPVEECRELFRETLKWLWLMDYLTRLDEPVPLAISQSTKLIDEMWHTFILFTPQYIDFCDKYFGRYLHHRPTPRSEYDQTISEYEQDPETTMTQNKEIFTKQYELIYDTLGEETLVRWYSTYLDRYTDGFMQSIWRWSFSP